MLLLLNFVDHHKPICFYESIQSVNVKPIYGAIDLNGLMGLVTVIESKEINWKMIVLIATTL